MKRIAIIRQKFNPAGGAERVVSAILRQLQGHAALHTLLINRKWEAVPGIEAHSVNPFYLGSVWRDWGFARAARRLWQALDAALVLSHERIPGCHVYRADDGVHAAWLDVRRQRGGIAARVAMALNPYHHYMLAMEQRMYRHPAFRGVVCISEMVKRDVMQYTGLPAERCHVVYNGIDSAFFNPLDARAQRDSLRQQYGLSADAPVLLYVGSGFERKGLAQALRAIVPHPAVQLVVVGSDKKSRHYQALASQLGVAGRVHFAGAQRDVRSYYGMADGFILPSIYEPFGLVVAEAMACGLTVLTSTRCGGGELLQPGQTGWLAAPDDKAAWQHNVGQWLAARASWPQRGEQARQAVLPYTEQRMVGQMLTLFATLLPDAEGLA